MSDGVAALVAGLFLVGGFIAGCVVLGLGARIVLAIAL